MPDYLSLTHIPFVSSVVIVCPQIDHMHVALDGDRKTCYQLLVFEGQL